MGGDLSVSEQSVEALRRLGEAQSVAYARSGASNVEPRVFGGLGSGLEGVVGHTEVEAAVPFEEVPGFPAPTVEGHAGRFLLGHAGGVPALIMQGRIHMYEGHHPATVALGVRAAKLMGADTLFVTNAAGGVNESFEPGDIMLITDHINMMWTNPLIGPNIDTLGPRFPAMAGAYDAELQKLAHTVATEHGEELRTGVYAGLFGPTFETPAEIKMLRTVGADAVGMSTVPEVIVARHAGMRVLGISMITNVAGSKHGHREVLETSKRRAPILAELVAGILSRL